MLPSVVFLFVFLAVPMDVLGDEVFVRGIVKCKKMDYKQRIAQTIEIDVGQEEGDTFTTTA